MDGWFHGALLVFTGVLVGWTFVLKRWQAGGDLSNALFFLALASFAGQWSPFLRPYSDALSWAVLGIQVALLGVTFRFLNRVRRK